MILKNKSLNLIDDNINIFSMYNSEYINSVHKSYLINYILNEIKLIYKFFELISKYLKFSLFKKKKIIKTQKPYLFLYP